MKIGYGRAKIKGIWKSWESVKMEIDLEKEKGMEKEEEEIGERGEGEEARSEDRNQNFS